MFDFIATRYDMINRVLAVGMDISWRKRMVNEIQACVASDSPRLLDLATGTADVALLLSQAMPDAKITGLDPSQQMLAQGREKIKARDLEDRIVLEWADARNLQEYQGKGLFDGATMAFGIRNIPERDQALCQIHSLLRDQACLGILEFSEPDPDQWGIMGHGARLFIRHVVPWLGGLLSGAPREYWHLQNSIKDFPKPNDFVKLLESVDCETGRYKVQDLIHMNYGSVQLYVSKVDRKQQDAVADEQEGKEKQQEDSSHDEQSVDSQEEAQRDSAHDGDDTRSEL
jgi:demethylmenaquinone methyltransferase / 2-methoxy-6-polyprenyl-1,4-benzoquinol methylase